MAQPLSNLDYLIDAVKRSPADDQPARPTTGPAPPTPMQEAVVAFGGPILRELRKAGGKLDAFQLVDATSIPLETLFRVLDTLSSDFHWVNVDKSDPKGNYQIELKPEALEYMQKSGL
jgi:hypothetical protein